MAFTTTEEELKAFFAPGMVLGSAQLRGPDCRVWVSVYPPSPQVPTGTVSVPLPARAHTLHGGSQSRSGGRHARAAAQLARLSTWAQNRRAVCGRTARSRLAVPGPKPACAGAPLGAVPRRGGRHLLAAEAKGGTPFSFSRCRALPQGILSRLFSPAKHHPACGHEMRESSKERSLFAFSCRGPRRRVNAAVCPRLLVRVEAGSMSREPQSPRLAPSHRAGGRQ